MRASRCGRTAAVVCGVLGVIGLGAPVGAWASTCPATGSCGFVFTGSEQTFTVPADVFSVHVTAVGAAGGGLRPGLGGTADATIPVTPGETLYVEVGGVGTPSAGGFNGGGAPGTGSTGNDGGGGGASDVRTVACGVATPCSGPSLSSRLVIAGGGGGSGAQGAQATGIAPGGDAGSAGSTGGNATAGVDGGGGGGAGTSSGGAGGPGGAGPGGTAGTAGGIGTLGTGGGGGGETAGSGNSVGGGGGGGYFGGGGGGGGGVKVGDQAAGGGGGGGSSLAPGGIVGTSGAAASVTLTYGPDTTAPTIAIARPASGPGYARGSTVYASYTCTDEANGSGVATCQGPVASGHAIDTSAVGKHTFTVTTSDRAGNATSQTVSYVVYGPPSASIAAPAPGGIYARGELVATRFACSEGPFGPGLARCTDSNGAAGSATSVSSRSGTGKLSTRKLGAHTYSVIAGSSDGLGGRAQISYTVAAPPAIAITSPADGATYTLGQLVKVHYTCKDGVFGSGIKSCTGKVRKGFPVNTLGLGHLTFTVTAVSKDGQQTSKTVSYRVPGTLGAPFALDTGSGPRLDFPRVTEFHHPQKTCTPRGRLRFCAPKPARIALSGAALTTAANSELSKWNLAYVHRTSAAAQTVILMTRGADGRPASVITLDKALLTKVKIVGEHTASPTVNITIIAESVSVK